jgi:hypothetical protein
MTSRKTRIVITLIVAALSVAAWTSSAAAADRVEVASRVTLAQTVPFHGKVLSKKAACERNRTVEVYRVDPGPRAGGPSRRVRPTGSSTPSPSSGR